MEAPSSPGGQDSSAGVQGAESAATDRPQRKEVQMLFSDLGRFKGKGVLISVYGGRSVKGRLAGFDEHANCVVELESSKSAIVFGRSIVAIFSCE
ncbi:hypothetical protein PAPHI01_0976 [Pancytospora philotis]|nr:hypothetical protein PAPHI01_0976 [Pancytospora philotis]